MKQIKRNLAIVVLGIVLVGGLVTVLSTGGLAGRRSLFGTVITTAPLTVFVSVSGDGSVTSVNSSDISCNQLQTQCTAAYPMGAVLTLKATPAAGAEFLGWDGPCPSGDLCPVSLTSDVFVTARFGPTPH